MVRSVFAIPAIPAIIKRTVFLGDSFDRHFVWYTHMWQNHKKYVGLSVGNPFKPLVGYVMCVAYICTIVQTLRA